MTVETWESRYAELLRALSHDLHAPVRQLESFKTLLKQSNTWNEEQRDYFEFIESALTKLMLRTQRVQALSNVLNMPLEYEWLDVQALIDSTEEKTLKDFANPISIESSIGVSSMVSSRVLLKSIFSEIMLNTQQYANKAGEGKLYIGVDSDHSHTRLLFRDFGPGIKEEWLSRALKPMVRLTDDTSDTGAGVGLTLVQFAVEKLGGELTLSNGCGLTIQVNLPFLDMMPVT